MPVELLNAKDVAKQLRVTDIRVYELINAREIEVTLIGKKRYMTQQAVDNYLSSHTLQPLINYNWLVKSYGQEAVDKFIKEHPLLSKPPEIKS